MYLKFDHGSREIEPWSPIILIGKQKQPRSDKLLIGQCRSLKSDQGSRQNLPLNSIISLDYCKLILYNLEAHHGSENMQHVTLEQINDWRLVLANWNMIRSCFFCGPQKRLIIQGVALHTYFLRYLYPSTNQ